MTARLGSMRLCHLNFLFRQLEFVAQDLAVVLAWIRVHCGATTVIVLLTDKTHIDLVAVRV
jgi:hypothetical protein